MGHPLRVHEVLPVALKRWAASLRLAIASSRTDSSLVNAGVAIYEQVQPNVPNRGLIVFEVAPNSKPQALIISDLVNRQGGEIAKVEL